MLNIIDGQWIVKTYSTPYALTQIDIMRDSEIRWTYWIMIQIYPDKKGVDNKGTRASGGAEACVVSATPREKQQHPLVGIGETISTPFGNYRIEWANKFNSMDKDNIALVEL